MIDNLWIALCLSFAGSTFFATRIWYAESKKNALLKKQFDKFLGLYCSQHNEVVDRIRVLEHISKSRIVK